MDIKEMLTALCGAAGVSGTEDGASAAALGILKSYTDDVRTDSMGNVYGFIGSRDNGKPTLLLEAHIDEIGLIVTYIGEDGFLKVGRCGGTDRRLYPAQTVTVHGMNGDITGVICTLPPHVADDPTKSAKTEDINIDIGYTTRDAAEKHVSPGDRVTIEAGFTILNETRFTAKAIDNRGGVVSVLYALELLKNRLIPYNIEVLFAAQEEVGSRGAAAGAFGSTADMAIAVDTSFAYTSDDKREDCGEMGKGAMIGISPVLDREITDMLKKAAAENGIPYQYEVMGGKTGTDADVISVTRGGIRTGLLSIPIKYMHTPTEVADIGDIDSVSRIIAAFVTGGGERDV